MPSFMNDTADIASDILKYKKVVEAIKESGALDDHEELKEKLDTAMTFAERAEYLRELATILENLGWIESGGTISKIAMGSASGIFSGMTAASTATQAVASVSTGSTVAGIVGGTAAGVGAASAVGGTAAGVTAGIIGGAAATAAAPIAIGVGAAVAVGYGVKKLWSSIFD